MTGQKKTCCAILGLIGVPDVDWHRLRATLRLISRLHRVESSLQLSHSTSLDRPRQHSTVTIHRYEELIAGRTYFIEVSAVDPSRWRAQIARLPGMPTALMPFYGPTPEDAARELSKWLTLVSGGQVR